MLNNDTSNKYTFKIHETLLIQSTGCAFQKCQITNSQIIKHYGVVQTKLSVSVGTLSQIKYLYQSIKISRPPYHYFCTVCFNIVVNISEKRLLYCISSHRVFCYTLSFFLYINVLAIKINIFTVFKKISKSLNQRSVGRQQFSVCWTGSDLLTACPTFIGYLKQLHAYVT